MVTGTILRVRLSDKTRWLLSSFAIQPEQGLGLETVARMRSLLRIAVDHACQHGASEVQAYIRQANMAPYLLCKREGFEEVEEYSGYMVSPSHIDAMEQAASLHPGIEVKKLKSSLPESLLWLSCRALIGYRKSIFLIQVEGNAVAEIALSTHTGVSSAPQLEMRPLAELTPEVGPALVASGLKICQRERRVLLIFPTACESLKQAMKLYQIPEVVRLKLLTLRLT